MTDRRRTQEAYDVPLQPGRKYRVYIKGELIPPEAPVESDGEFVVTPTSVEVWLCETMEDETAVDGFRPIRITDQVLTVAVFDSSLPSLAAPESKADAYYGHVEIFDGVPELTWVSC